MYLSGVTWTKVNLNLCNYKHWNNNKTQSSALSSCAAYYAVSRNLIDNIYTLCWISHKLFFLDLVLTQVVFGNWMQTHYQYKYKAYRRQEAPCFYQVLIMHGTDMHKDYWIIVKPKA